MNKRCNVLERVDVPVDRLSNLPDLVLSHVLSLLPTTEEAVRTSILSKRWKNLWTYVHTLVLVTDWKPVASHKMQFSQFVGRVLQFHRGSLKRMKLSIPSLHWDKGDNDYDIRNWISYAIDRDVEVLHLSLPYLKFSWPVRLFNSETLVDLSLSNVHISNLSIPSASFFPSLKKLAMSVDKSDLESLHLLISGCLALEDLDITIMAFDELSLNFSSSILKRLAINCIHGEYDFDHNFNRKIELDVPALEFFGMRCTATEIVVKDQLLSLTEVNIDIFGVGTDVNEDLCCHSIVKLMERISNVKILRLISAMKKPLTYVMNAKFPNLTKLEIRSSFFEWPLLGSFMESSINLEFISLEQRSIDMENQVRWIDPQNVPHCLLSSLRKMSVNGCSVGIALGMVDYVLKHAELLTMMDIKNTDYDTGYETQCRLLNRLVMMKRASRACEISFTAY